MKKFSNYEETQAYTNGGEKLPAGGYVLKVENVRYENGQNGNSDRIVLMFDIAEGEQKDFYRKQYDSQTSEDKKWKGTMQIYVPKDDGSEQDNWSKRKFKTIMEDFEASNGTYKWNWDENSLKSKLIGGLFGEIATKIDGKDITYVGLRYTETVENIRTGNFKVPTLYSKGGAATTSTSAGARNDDFMKVDSKKEEIPF